MIACWRPKKRHLVLLFLIGTAAVQAVVEWDKVRRLSTAAYEFVEAAVNNRIIYSEKRVESHLAPIRKEIADIKKKVARPPVCTCSAGATGSASGRTPTRNEPFSIFPGK